MSRQALLVANSVTYLDTQKSVPRRLLLSTVARISAALSELPQQEYRFKVTPVIDQPWRVLRQEILEASDRAASSNSLLLFYYFGHGALDAELELQFAHPKDELVPLRVIENLLRASRVERLLVVLDCCYASARKRTFESSLRGECCMLAATTGTAKANIHYQDSRPPIGAFTQALLDGLTDPRACVSSTNTDITAASLFKYAGEKTRTLTNGFQVPHLSGALSEVLTRYARKPTIIDGLSKAANKKSGYYKLFAICRALGQQGYPTLTALYREILLRDRKSFLLRRPLPNGHHADRPARAGALLRYIRFLRVLGLVAPDELRISRKGKEMFRSGWQGQFNRIILEALDSYLGKYELDRDTLERILTSILEGRRLPTWAEIRDYLARTGHRLPGPDLRLILDVLGYSGSLRLAKDRAYFPW